MRGAVLQIGRAYGAAMPRSVMPALPVNFRFRGSKREISFGRILIPAFSPGEENGSAGGWRVWMPSVSVCLTAKAAEGCRSTGRFARRDTD